jgi:serine/threonine-protein kinase
LALLAEGGMGQVWLARLVGKRGFEKLVAIKTLLPKFAADPRFQGMFLDEARIASGIEHPNVAQILDLGEQGDILFLIMELVDGESLSKLTRALHKAGVSMPLPIACRIVADTAAGIHAAHGHRGQDGKELGIVHRDISPQNILISSNGVAKLIDFGIAKARDRFSGETSEGILKGKVHYMPAEQAMGKKLDRRADVFALGAVLYHLITGSPAYDGDSPLEILRYLTSGRPPPPLPDVVPLPIIEVVFKALAFLPEDRFQTAADMQRALTQAMGKAGLAADTGDVAAFVAKHTGARAERRRKAIDAALKAAADRATTNAALLKPLSSKSSLPGLTPVNAGQVTTAGGQSIPEADTSNSYSSVDMLDLPIDVEVPNKNARLFAMVAIAGGVVLLLLIVGTGAFVARAKRNASRAQDPQSAIFVAASRDTPSPPMLDSAAAPDPAPSSAMSRDTVSSAPLPSSAPSDSPSAAGSAPVAQNPQPTQRKPAGRPPPARGTASARPKQNGPDFGY